MKKSTENKVAGKATELKGKVKEAAGRATNNPRLQDEGNDQKIAGKIRSKVGDIQKVFDK